MRFIRKRNLQEGEELLYAPSLHWMYPIRHIVLSLPFFLVLFFLWEFAAAYADLVGEMFGAAIVMLAQTIIRNVFLAVFFVVALVFVWRIFLFLSTEYGVTNKRLIIKRGIVRLVVSEIPTDRIESMHCVQGLLGRLFRYGTICICGVGGRMPMFRMVCRPYMLRRKIVDIIEKNKTVTVVHGEIPRPQPAPEPESLIYRYGTFVRVLQK